MEKSINIKLKIWRQRGPKEPGSFVDYSLDNVPTDISFLEMLDMLNEQLIEQGEEPIVFDNDCREGICGMCSLYINGNPHGPVGSITTCQLHMRKFNDGDTITIEPWRSHAFPVIRDLAAPAMPTQFPFRKKQPTKPWILPLASVAAHVSQLARTDRPCCSFLQK